MTGRLEGHVAVVTGAGGGIGEAYCRRFVDEGARVAVVDIGREQGNEVADALGDDAVFVHCDISDEASVDACRDAVLDAFGTVDCLVNNAAIYGELDLGDQSVEYLRKVFDVNVIGQWLMCRAFAPTMVQKGRGRIINIGSIAGYLPLGTLAGPGDPETWSLGNYSYQQTKFAVLGLTRQLAGELGKYGVTANTLAPGLVMTPATDKQVPGGFDQVFADMSAAKRNSQAEDMCGPAVFLASDESAMVNGQILCVDGGNVMPT
ncbi:MAG: 3-alpha-(or 20-beta)-hydroxysteroid dehydrogenase [Acidimicrobiales bacterium]|nr:MAG: 3-alpha-(or 20-beta)-hydroxysteroid dehydrogenase [Acidimicrobiales bacterium]